ncbi:hypothetical protein MYAM1_001456 [Malassezia yamatoensis]|uniref:Ribosome assembly protein 3 n=1 Tax=Malassezia yamatoensis TaxID=253288 RepID=A0AAJ5YYD3_9BASI|nr:hypothetical protein MYAM1_001456 [Malassezia yamatoensis]
MTAASAVSRRPKRKRVRKTRTAVVSSSSESSSSDESLVVKSTEDKPSATSRSSINAQEPSKDGYATDSDDEFGEQLAEPTQKERDMQDLADTLDPPQVRVETGEHDAEQQILETSIPKDRVDGRIASLAPQAISQELREKRKAAFRALWMQALTEEFGTELDDLRQNDAKLSAGSTNASNATGPLPLLIDSLSFGSEVLAGVDGKAIDEVSIALPHDRLDGE